MDATTPLRGHGTSKLMVALVIGVVGAFVLLASSCGQSAATATLPTPSAAPAPSTAAPPLGGPVPAQLLGDWFLPPALVAAIEGNVGCRLLKLTLTATTYHLTHTTLGVCGSSSSGEVVVNHTEIDFFNGDGCLNPVPGGVGRYTAQSCES